MPVILVPISLGLVAIATSVIGLKQRRWPPLRMAILLGWLGPLPGYLSVVQPFPVELSPSTEIIGYLGKVLLYYAVLALPLLGTYCFVLGLVGGFLIDRYTRAPAPRWIRPASIIVFTAAAALPVILVDGGDKHQFGRAAIVSAICCALAILRFSDRIFTGDSHDR